MFWIIVEIRVIEHPFSYGKKEKLKSRKLIDQLFTKGKSIQHFPLRLSYAFIPDATQIQAGVSVSKRYFKKAVQRNRIKRLMREAYRLNKHLLNDVSSDQGKLAIFILYTDKELPAFEQINDKMKELLSSLAKRLNGTV